MLDIIFKNIKCKNKLQRLNSKFTLNSLSVMLKVTLLRNTNVRNSKQDNKILNKFSLSNKT